MKKHKNIISLLQFLGLMLGIAAASITIIQALFPELRTAGTTGLFVVDSALAIFGG